jgi:NTP pyrophosphatase (non-canonical NTP hydrolase)
MTVDATTTLDELRGVFAELTELHGWGPLQTPRSLTLALTGRVGAVASLQQWQPETGIGADVGTAELRNELADCLVYLVALSDVLGVDVVGDAVTRLQGAVDGSRSTSMT